MQDSASDPGLFGWVSEPALKVVEEYLGLASDIPTRPRPTSRSSKASAAKSAGDQPFSRNAITRRT